MAEAKPKNTIVAPKPRMTPEARLAYTLLGSFILTLIVAAPAFVYPRVAPFLLVAIRRFFSLTNELLEKATGFAVTKSAIVDAHTYVFAAIATGILTILIPSIAYVYDTRQSWREFFRDNPYVEKFIDAIDVPRFWFQAGWMLGVSVVLFELYVGVIYNWYDVSA